MVDALDVVDLVHLLVANEGINQLENSCNKNRHVWPIIADDVEQARHDIPAHALQVLEQGSPDVLVDASPALDVKDCRENALVVQRSDVDPIRGDNVEALQVAIRPTI